MNYYKSETAVTSEQIAKLEAQGIANAWTNPRTGATRHYINYSGLAQLIGLNVVTRSTGSVSDCTYIDAEGDEVRTANSRAFSKAYDKCFIEGGIVTTTWQPYDESIAELIAIKANER